MQKAQINIYILRFDLQRKSYEGAEDSERSHAPYFLPFNLCRTEDALSHFFLGIDTGACIGNTVLEKRLKNMKKKEELYRM